MPDDLRIALAQMNAVVGDIDGNAAKVERLAAEAREAGAQLVVFPELTLTGYPPEDLLLKRGFLRRAQAALEGLAVGRHHGDRRLAGGRPAAAFTTPPRSWPTAQVQAVYRKMLLPNYGVFDERRWFEPGERAARGRTWPARRWASPSARTSGRPSPPRRPRRRERGWW